MKKNPLIIEEIKAPLNSMDCFRLFKKEPFLFFLASNMDEKKLGRFSFLGFDPFLTFHSKKNFIWIKGKDSQRNIRGENPFLVLKELLKKYRFDTRDTQLPFVGGAVGYFSYDLCHHVEKLPDTVLDDLNLPDSYMLFYDVVIIFDHLKGKIFVASSGFPELEPDKRSIRAKERLDLIKGRLLSFNNENNSQRFFQHNNKIGLLSNFKKEEYIAAINKAKDYIKDGDIYQVNLSQRFTTELDMHPAELFEQLSIINPAPFASYLDFQDFKIVSSSPERFLCKRGRNIHTRPIKGTRPRSINHIEDKKLKEELIKSPKDRAEHVMIVDLERNDLGRICEYGTVLPTEFIILEPYSTVSHLVSRVSGILRADVDPVDCLMNCFPGGSITGAPKIRSMEIIDELEPTGRSIYTGSIGYIGFDGNMDTSIVIRTFIIKDKKAYFQVGGGIVADSDPEMEYQETLDKAKALMDALSITANRYCGSPLTPSA